MGKNSGRVGRRFLSLSPPPQRAKRATRRRAQPEPAVMNVKRTLFACGVALALLLAVSTQGAHALKWKLCEGDWEAKIVNATVLPDPARAGDEINVIINGEIGRKVQSGALDLIVLFHKIPVYKEHDDLCDRLESCPANGPFTVDAKQKLPPFTLPAQGTYQLKVTAKDESAKEVVCMILDLQIKGPAIF